MNKINITKEIVKRKAKLTVNLKEWVQYLEKFKVDETTSYKYNSQTRTRYKIKSALLYVCDIQSYSWLYDTKYMKTGIYEVPIGLQIKQLETILIKIYVWASRITTTKLTKASVKKFIKEVEESGN